MKAGKGKAGTTKKNDSKLSVKKAAAGKKPAGKAAKDPNKPKRPASAFFVFMEDFRKSYKEKHPNNKSVSVEKAPFVAKAEKRKVEYNKVLQAYNKKLAEGNDEEDEEESDKSKSEINDEDDSDGSEEEDDEE
ncbi:High mobility group b protein [Thalictrum thalictroides]|uniref:High mobility group b protein n=1 Tax=Thalictrum thalictroides TaxID=46969 RepID=A0A7J6VIX2_THATH|nr:High mobility group b protein [Thalictrum thalictroides]